MAKAEGFAKVVVCDAGPLIHLDELGCLDLFGDFSEVLVPEAVWREVLGHRPSALDKKGAVLVRVPPSLEQTAPLLRGIFAASRRPWLSPRNTRTLFFSPTTRRQGWPQGFLASASMEPLVC